MKNMLKKVSVLLISGAALSGTVAQAESLRAGIPEAPVNKAFCAYDLGFMTTLDNREYDKTTLDYSRTLFGAGLGAAVGLGYRTEKSSHRVLAGVSALYEFGGELRVKPVFYYQFATSLTNSKFGITAGVFPRGKQKAYYSLAFYNEAVKFKDNSYEGIQFDWTGRNFYYELGADWMGQLRTSSPDTREQFYVYSGGHHKLIPGIKLGYSAYLHHYACNASGTAKNVVDHILINPYADFELGHKVNMQSLFARLGYLQSAQRDREVSSGMIFPAKGEVLLEARNWNVGIANDLFFGGDLMPYFDSPCPEGGTYDEKLYVGDRFMRNAGGKSFGVYDKVSVYYEPQLAKNLSLRLQINVHFNGGFAGWQQFIVLKYNMAR